MNAFEWIQTVASVATAAGVGLAASQLFLSKRQVETQFEDHLASQYREIARQLPIEALLGEELANDRHEQALPYFYHYIDLTNEQVFLRMKGRIRKDTWADWCQGIRVNLARPAFSRAWEQIKSRSPDTFEELRALERSKFVES